MCLNIIELFNPQHGFARHGQLCAFIKVKELTPHMGHAGHLFDASRSVRIKEMAWREDTNRQANGTQFTMAIGAVAAAPVSRQWAGYWRRHTA
ncbi:MAG: hypothetical protein ACI8YI_001581 [Paracoccaceae bacterium]